MTRTGKIARSPRNIRDELHRRLDNGEPGVHLVEWLNSLPEVQQVLKTYFGGHEITEKNLSDWKTNGYLDWQGQQESLATARELKAKASELTAESDGDLTESLATIVAAGYAAALDGWNGEITDEIRRKLRGLKAITREVLRLERMNIQREWLSLGYRRYEDSKRSDEKAALHFCLDETRDYPEVQKLFEQAFDAFRKARTKS
jgi:hypothetical protein